MRTSSITAVLVLTALTGGCATTVTVLPTAIEAVQKPIIRLKVSVPVAIDSKSVVIGTFGGTIRTIPAETVIAMIRNEIGKKLPENIVLVDGGQDATLEVWQVVPHLETPWWSYLTAVVTLTAVMPASWNTKSAARLVDNQGNILFTYNIVAEFGFNRFGMAVKPLTIMDWDEFAKQLAAESMKELKQHFGLNDGAATTPHLAQNTALRQN